MELIDQLVIEHDDPTDVQAEFYWQPIHVAAYYGHLNVIQWLVEHGAHIDAKADLGWEPIHTAAAHGHQAPIEWLVTRPILRRKTQLAGNPLCMQY